jgi:hypothetical protein
MILWRRSWRWKCWRALSVTLTSPWISVLKVSANSSVLYSPLALTSRPFSCTLKLVIPRVSNVTLDVRNKEKVKASEELKQTVGVMNREILLSQDKSDNTVVFRGMRQQLSISSSLISLQMLGIKLSVEGARVLGIGIQKSTSLSSLHLMRCCLTFGIM